MWRVVLVTSACILVGCAQPEGVQVRSVIDGDTIEVLANGRLETVRLLGIDTPETVHPDKPAECFGPEASALLAKLLPRGASVTLTRDAEARDHFGRLLAFVTRDADGLEINQHLVEAGVARTLSIAPNTTMRAQFVIAEQRAKQAEVGLWGAC